VRHIIICIITIFDSLSNFALIAVGSGQFRRKTIRHGHGQCQPPRNRTQLLLRVESRWRAVCRCMVQPTGSFSLKNGLRDSTLLYVKVERLSGPGDKGRNVVGFTGAPDSNPEWDNYQCTHYRLPLQPKDIWVELGKICYYAFNGDYRPTRKYRFVAPNEVSPTLKELLKTPGGLKNGLKQNWHNYCKNESRKAPPPERSNLRGHSLRTLTHSKVEVVGINSRKMPALTGLKILVWLGDLQ